MSGHVCIIVSICFIIKCFDYPRGKGALTVYCELGNRGSIVHKKHSRKVICVIQKASTVQKAIYLKKNRILSYRYLWEKVK